MNSFLIFTRKELTEQIRTFKGIVLLAVLLIFGMTSPLLAKLTPEIVKMSGLGAQINLPAPTFLDAYAQFFKNISQITLIVLILVFVGSVVSETTKGTAQLVLTKRLSRSVFILSKFTAGAIVWTVSYLLSSALCVVYTVYLFPGGKPRNLLFSLLCMWLFGLLTLAVSIFCSAVLTSYPLAAAGGFCLWGLLYLTCSLPKVKENTPALLGSVNAELISGTYSAGRLAVPLVLCIACTALLLFLSCFVFRRREL